MKEINFMAACIEDSVLYGAGYMQNILFQFDMAEESMIQKEGFKQFKNPYSFCIQAIFKHRKKLYCFSSNSYEIAVYHLENKTITYYHYLDDWQQNHVEIHCVCCIGNQVWMLQRIQDPLVVVFCMEKEKYMAYKVDLRILQNFNITLGARFDTYINVGTSIWRCIPGNNAFLVFDTQKLKMEIVKLDVPCSPYTFSFSEDCFYIIEKDGKRIVVWNQCTKKSIVWETGYCGNKDRPFREAVRIKNKLFLIPFIEDEIYYYEICNEQIYYICRLEYPIDFKRTSKGGLFTKYYLEKEKELYLFPFSGNGMLCLNIDNLKFKFYSICISDTDFIVNQIQARLPLNDTQVTLKGFLDYIKSIIQDEENCFREYPIGKISWEKARDYVDR